MIETPEGRLLIEKAESLEKMAKTLRREAERMHDKLKIQKRLDDLKKIPDKYRAMRLLGMPPHKARETIARNLDIPEGTVIHYCSQAENRRRDAGRIRRNREIMRLARLGHSNKHIGEIVGLHPNSITRIITQELKR